MNSKNQFNGLVLLYGYLQRLFVYEKISGMLGINRLQEHGRETLPPLLDTIGGMLHGFDPAEGLSGGQIGELMPMIQHIQDRMNTSLTAGGDSLPQQLAHSGAALYAEEHINNGIIRLGDLFDSDTADRFRQRIPYYRNRVNRVSHLVQKAAAVDSLSSEESETVKEWARLVKESAAHVNSDFNRIRELIGSGQTPEEVPPPSGLFHKIKKKLWS